MLVGSTPCLQRLRHAGAAAGTRPVDAGARHGDRVKTLTLTQPWATLCAIGAKTIETRGWNTAYRGPLAIHAAKGFGKADVALIQANDHFRRPLIAAGYLGMPIDAKSSARPMMDLPLGAIVAVCELLNVHPTDANPILFATRERPQELLFGNFSSGRYAWLLGNIRRLPEPIPAIGALNLWNWVPPASSARAVKGTS
jgi:activating signal cointegrator 1